MYFKLDHLWWLAVAIAIFLGATMLMLVANLGLPSPSVDRFAIIVGYSSIAACAVTFVGLGISGLRRSWLRRAAIRGDVSGLKHANIEFDPLDDLHQSERLRPLIWRPLRLGLMLSMTFAVVYSTGQAADAFISLAAETYHTLDPLRIPVQVAAIASTLACLPCCVLLYFYLRNRRIIVTADANGISRESLFGIRHTVRWEDARLLEVAAINGACAFVLWGTHSHVWWDEILRRENGDVAPDGISFPESEERARQLVNSSTWSSHVPACCPAPSIAR